MTAKEIGSRLRMLRNSRTLAQVSEATGLGISALSNYEQGLRIPNDYAKSRLSEYFGVDVGSLFFDKNYTISVDKAM